MIILLLSVMLIWTFARFWPYEDELDPTSVKLRMGFPMCIANCLVIWQSNSISEIALSTMKAEYCALPIAMKTLLLIPLRRFMSHIRTTSFIKRSGSIDESAIFSQFRCTVHENDTGTLVLANKPPGEMMPMSKHFDCKYHWFCRHLKPRAIEVHKIQTDLHGDGIMTEFLVRVKFEMIRKL